jgi:hypothetical protein
VKSVTDSKWQKEAAGEQSAFYSLRPRPESRFIGNNRLFRPRLKSRTFRERSALYSRNSSPETEEQSALSPETGEPIGSLPDRQKEAACPQGLDPDFGGPFTRTSCASARSPSPARPGESRRASAHMCSSFFLSPTLARAWRASNYLS